MDGLQAEMANTFSNGNTLFGSSLTYTAKLGYSVNGSASCQHTFEVNDTVEYTCAAVYRAQMTVSTFFPAITPTEVYTQCNASGGMVLKVNTTALSDLMHYIHPHLPRLL